MTDLISHNQFSVTVDKVRKGDMILLPVGGVDDEGDSWYLVQEENMGGMYGTEHIGQHLVRVISHLHDNPFTLMTYGDEYGNGGNFDGDMIIDHWFASNERVTIRTPYNQVPVMTNDGRLVRWWVNVYEVGQGYGGPEEGGWWFDTGELQATVAIALLEVVVLLTLWMMTLSLSVLSVVSIASSKGAQHETT
jgi:hypothetical protein